MPLTEIVRYQADDGTVVGFEIDPPEGFSPASTHAVLGRVRDAAVPAIEAAKAVLERAKELSPDGIEVKFGIKVTGAADWLIAKSSAEGSFEVTLKWDRSEVPAADTVTPEPIPSRSGD
ncbi:CU044_2847 family protein [Dactylosporangium sp. NPDC050588]|uniref:CU044_2847 family protein n=1 Tax=Dactylosporangium sp. NPDC050588 TaxID=3157211 RepID=UPI0033C6293B